MPGISVQINNSSLDANSFELLCEEVLAFLEEITPVDTGLCRDSWEMDFAEDECTFTNDTEYASYLDEGWSKQAPQGMIQPMLQELPSMVSGYK
jgi:hypothetical protein